MLSKQNIVTDYNLMQNLSKRKNIINAGIALSILLSLGGGYLNYTNTNRYIQDLKKLEAQNEYLKKEIDAIKNAHSKYKRTVESTNQYLKSTNQSLKSTNQSLKSLESKNEKLEDAIKELRAAEDTLVEKVKTLPQHVQQKVTKSPFYKNITEGGASLLNRAKGLTTKSYASLKNLFKRGSGTPRRGGGSVTRRRRRRRRCRSSSSKQTRRR